MLCAMCETETETDLGEITKRIGTVLCPFTNFCHFNATDQLEENSEFDPCCSSCSCDDSCYDAKTCCPDKPGVAKKCKFYAVSIRCKYLL